MKIIAITGKSGSGKSTVSDTFRQEGFTVLDADLAAKKAVENKNVLQKLQSEFGDDIIENNVLNRKLLAKRAFENEHRAKVLANITHPEIVRLLLLGVQNAQNSGEHIVFVDGAVIIGGLFEKHCNEFIVVFCNEENMLKRLLVRDGLNKEQAKKRLESQLAQENYLKAANYVLENNGTKEELVQKAKELLRLLV